MADWIGDAFAILCVRIGGLSAAEKNLRLGFEALLRQLGTSPLRFVAQKPPPLSANTTASITDLRHIAKALDSCLAVFQRYDAVLTPPQRRIQILVRATRRLADEELGFRRRRVAALDELTAAAA